VVGHAVVAVISIRVFDPALAAVEGKRRTNNVCQHNSANCQDEAERERERRGGDAYWLLVERIVDVGETHRYVPDIFF
jgi:hypothetical protein